MNITKEYGIRRTIILDYGTVEYTVWQGMSRAAIDGKWGHWYPVTVAGAKTLPLCGKSRAQVVIDLGDVRKACEAVNLTPDVTLEVLEGLALLPTQKIDYNPHGLM